MFVVTSGMGPPVCVVPGAPWHCRRSRPPVLRLQEYHHLLNSSKQSGTIPCLRASPQTLAPIASPPMDAQVPAVVAVVVTTDPGPWFDETLSSLAAQDYARALRPRPRPTGPGRTRSPSGSVGSSPTPSCGTCRDGPGYAAASNEALGMVEGAAFFLLCHDDVALDPDAVHQLVEESFRSNAGVVSPKFVNWDDPQRPAARRDELRQDRSGGRPRSSRARSTTGSTTRSATSSSPRAACILVRADLFAELKGFDPGIVAMGEDLDLSWRCQVAGSRVVVAPDARVRHREVVAGGLDRSTWPARDAGDTPSPCRCCSDGTSCAPCSSATPRLHLVRVLPAGGPAGPRARSSSRCWPATATGPGPWPARGAGTSGG